MSTAAPRPLGLEILSGSLRGSRLIQDYLADAAQLAPFYAGSPWDAAAYARKLEDVDRRFGAAQRRGLADIIGTTSAASRERLQQIVEGNGLIVTTGQQPALFGGPLYTVYKVLSAVSLAAALESVLQRPVSALFWVASNDHDWQEANHASVIDAGGALQRITMPDDGAAPVSMQHRRLGDAVDAALDELTQALPATEFTPALLERLRSAYAPEQTMARAFTRDLATLFEPLNVLMADASNPALLRAAVPIFQRELANSTEHAALLSQQSERLVAAGYHAQVPIAADAANLMFEDERGRERLVREGGAWLLRRTKRTFSDSDLRALIDDRPEQFSPNVLLRPVIESAVLPTVAYVGGPAEVSYFGQIAPLFAAHGVGMPLVLPRHHVTLVEPKVRKVLDKFTLEVEDLRRPVQEVTAQVVRDDLPAETGAALESLRSALQEGYTRLQDSATPIDPTLSGPIGKARSASETAVRDVERKILAHLRSRNEVSIEQVRKAALNLFPNGEPQERVLGAFQYVARYGDDFVPAVANVIQVELRT